MWADLIVSYAKSKGIYEMSLNELYSSPICHNKDINRKLSLDSLKIVVEYMS